LQDHWNIAWRFTTLAGARQYAREEALEAWDIFHGDLLVERREPEG
jgi:hypothetical protein